MQKVDPYYAPIQVEPYIQKCESVGSIVEYLALHKDNGTDEPPKFMLPVNNPTQQAIDLHTDSISDEYKQYVLQPSPHSTWSDKKNTSTTSVATTATLPQLDESTVYREAELNFGGSTNYSKSSQGDGNNTVACSNLLFERKHCSNNYRTSSSSSDDSFSSVSTTGSAALYKDASAAEFCDTKNITYNLDELILSKPDEYSDEEGSLELSQDNRIVLTFSPQSCNENVITIDSDMDSGTIPTSSSEEQDTQEDMPESLTETNLTINPHHFDPL